MCQGSTRLRIRLIEATGSRLSTPTVEEKGGAMARRGLLAELNRQLKLAEADRKRREREAERARNAAIRRADQARKAEERAMKEFSRAEAAHRNQLEKEARRAHVATMEAEVERLSLELGQTYQDLDTLLAATLDVDDFVDLEELRTSVHHPPFDRTDLRSPEPAPRLPNDPPKPELRLPIAPSGLSRLVDFGRHRRATEQAHASHARSSTHWEAACQKAEAERARLLSAHAEAEDRRVQDLAAAEEQYRQDCAAREAQVAKQNAELDQLITNLGYGVPEAVQEYVDIVLANSVYPDHFPVDYSFEFEASNAELVLRVVMPAPASVSNVKAYRYVKSKDEISESSLSQKAARDRYSSAVHQVALRTLHEIFEADRRALIKTIALEVGTETTHPATGLVGFIPFVAVGAERDTFVRFELAEVVPQATLEHLGASLSKDPFGLLPAEMTGIRKGE